MFTTDRGNSFRVNVCWKGAHLGCERADWIGDEMSFYSSNPLGTGSFLVHGTEQFKKDDAGFNRSKGVRESYNQLKWWQ